MEAAVADHERADEAPLLHDLIVKRSIGTLRARERERAELELARGGRFPCPAPAVAVETRDESAPGPELQRVFGRIVGGANGAVAALEPDELPLRAFERPRFRGR